VKRRLSILPVLIGGLIPGAAAAARVQWLGPLPPEAQRLQAERSTGPVTHIAASELAWPVEADALHQAEQSFVAMGGVLDDCAGRWEAFDVEQDIAWRLGEAVGALRIIEGQADRDALIQLLLFQGAAVHWAWSPQQRARLQQAEPYLLEIAGERLYQPWVDAVALDPERAPERGDFPDQASYQAFQRQRALLLEQPRGVLEVTGLPAGTTLMIDGLPVQHEGPVELVAGLHRVHLDRGEAVAVPRMVRLRPGERHGYGGLIHQDQLLEARDRVLAGNLLDVPQEVKDRVEAMRAQAGGEQTWLAAWGGRGAPQLYELTGDEPWMLGEFDDDMAVVLDLALGAGVMSSTAFAESDGTTAHGALATGLGLGAQLAWRRWAGVLELTLQDTSGRAGIEYGEVASGTNVTTSAFTRLTAGPAFYVMRLRPRRTSFVVGLPVGLQSPSHGGLGVQAWFGIPVGQTTWLRLGAELFKGNELPNWEAIDGVNDPLTSISLRVGVAQKVR
jgi:hypothetical protein